MFFFYQTQLSDNLSPVMILPCVKKKNIFFDCFLLAVFSRTAHISDPPPDIKHFQIECFSYTL